MGYRIKTEFDCWIPQMYNRKGIKLQRDTDKISFRVDFIWFNIYGEIMRHSYIPEDETLLDKILFKRLVRPKKQT